jgi:hypothetical protein
MSSRSEHESIARVQRELPEPAPDAVPDLRSWVRLGTLAASSHNTQPWRVGIDADAPAIAIRPDRARRCPVVDPDDAHLFKSLGCMAENIRLAAGVNGFDTGIEWRESSGELRLSFEHDARAGDEPLYRAIATRQCTRSAYDGSALGESEREALLSSGTGDGVTTRLLETPEAIEGVVAFVERGNEAQLGDAAFRRELTDWIRFNPAAAIRCRDGLSGLVMGQPALPQWLGRALVPLLLKPGVQNRRDAEHIRSSSALAVLVAERDAPDAWIETGRVVQRLTLKASVLGLKHAYINQPIEDRALRPEFARWLGLDSRHPLLMLRIGRAEPAAYSLRRPIEDILIDPGESRSAR